VIKISLHFFQNWTQNTMGIVVLWLFFGFCAFSVDAQQPYAIHLNKTNGLPSNSVYTVFQDSKGFIWLATNEGLSMYDGFSYTTFKSDEQTSTPGSCIKEDKMGRIWYENFDGNLYYVDHHRKKLQSIALNPTVGFVPFAITDLYLLVFQKEGVDAYDISNLKFIKTVPLKITNLHHATNDTQNIYFIHDNKLYKIDQNLELTSSKEHYNPEELNKQLYFTDNGFIVVSKYNEQKKIHLFDNQLKEDGALDAAEPQFIQGASYIDDAYWIHTTKGSVGGR
jgi:ligand-binding sensor domain-containing protein